MRVLFSTSELYPHVKTGGLGDVAAGLPPALQKVGVDIRYFLPGYSEVKRALRKKKIVREFADLFGRPAKLLLGDLPNGIRAYVLDIPEFYHRSQPYLTPDGSDWPDNHLRFGVFSYVAAQLADYDVAWQPDIQHGNDWQSGLIPYYTRLRDGTGPVPRSVTTIHNLCYQGLFAPAVIDELGLRWRDYAVYGFEYYNKVGFLKAGLFYADRITTVSPTYATEICTSSIGCGLEGLLATRRDDLVGILNGIDDNLWNPQSDPAIRYAYNRNAPAARRKNKKALLKEINLTANEDEPLFAFVGRLTPQKGVDILLGAFDDMSETRFKLLIIGTGDAVIQEKCCALMAKYPDRVHAHMGYNEDLAHRIMAGADALVVPSYFEPCGLVQLFALRYGALPIVRRTGGLADSVSAETGFLFDDASASALREVVMQAIDAYVNDQPRWKKMQKKAMGEDFTWHHSANQYLDLYRALIG